MTTASPPALQAREVYKSWFPSFGPMQFAVGGSFARTALWGHLALGLAWTAAFTTCGLIIFRVKTRSRTHRATAASPR